MESAKQNLFCSKLSVCPCYFFVPKMSLQLHIPDEMMQRQDIFTFTRSLEFCSDQ